MEQLEAMRRKLAEDTMDYLIKGGIIKSVPMGQTALDPLTGMPSERRTTFLESSRRGSMRNKRTP